MEGTRNVSVAICQAIMFDPNFAMLVVDIGRNGYTASTLLSYISFQTQPFILFLTHTPGTGPGFNFEHRPLHL